MSARETSAGRRAGPRGADLVHAFANLGRDHRQAERRVDLLLGRGDRCCAVAAKTLRPERHPRSAAMRRKALDVLARSR